MERRLGYLLLSAVLAGAAPSAGAETAQLERAPANPIQSRIQPSGLAVALADYVRVPTDPERGPPSRIVLLTHAGDGSDRQFVVDMRGKIYVIKDGRLLDRPFLDLAPLLGGSMLDSEFENGLTSIAFHPDFANPDRPGFGRFYTVSVHDPELFPAPRSARLFGPPGGEARHHAILAEWRVSAQDPDRADPGSHREVLRLAFQHNQHQMYFIAFNPAAEPRDKDHGLLYVGVGDGGDTFAWDKVIDKDRQGPDPGTPFAAVLRIDPLPDGQDPYRIPPDNPFAAGAGGMAEVWAYGLRNPQRFTWDTGGSGLMLIADIGQAHIEEINIGRPGADYGWSRREGTFVVDSDDQSVLYHRPATDRQYGYTYPVAQYDRDDGVAVTAGYVYRGGRVPEITGEFLFGDIVNGRIFHIGAEQIADGRLKTAQELTLLRDGRPVRLIDLVGAGRADLRFGQDEAGEIYLLTKQDGWIRRLESAGPAAAAGPVDRRRLGDAIWAVGGLVVLVVFGLVAVLRFRRSGSPQ